ncbi:MAG: PAS domain S-box protein, partial [Methanomicrobiales archaeon]
MTLNFSEIIRKYSGWCPNAPTMRTTPAVFEIPPDMVNPAQPGSGGTTIRDVVLAMAIGLLAASALALVIAQGTVDTFRRWYAFGLLLLGVGLIGIMVQKSLGSPLNWIARAAQYLGAVYLLVASLPYASRVRRWSLPLEAALRQAEAQARDLKEALIARASAPIVVWDAARRITLFNRAFEQMTGYPADEVLGRDLVLLFPEASRVESLARIAATAEGTRWESVEIPIRCKSGEVRLVLWNSASALEATIAQGQDITERKRAEEALRESEARLRAFVNAIPGPVFLKDLDSRWLVGNRALFEVVGKSASFAIGKTDREIFDDPAVGDAVMENDRRIMKSGVPEVVEETIPTPAGTRIFHSTKVPHRDASGRVVGIIGSALDITETRTLQGQLAVASRLAALGTLVAGVAHEINNPLTGVMAGVGTAMLDVQDHLEKLERGDRPSQEALIERGREVLEMLREASEAAARIKSIVRDLSVFGAPTQDRARLRASDIVAGAMRWLPSSVHTLATVSVEDLGA